ncbi:MAG TPA: GrpB family protein [Dongiaceae bacterium]|nr:GrpB family protein [Dongiaceae bacterium]
MDEVEIVDYDPRWPALFAEEAARLRAVLDGSLIVGLEHFGSTAIPGMAAKPVIDILIAVRSLAAARETFIESLKGLDYVFWADNPKTDRLFFVKGMPPYGERAARIRSMSSSGLRSRGNVWGSATTS